MPESEILSPTTYRQDSVFKDHSNFDKLKTAIRRSLVPTKASRVTAVFAG